MHGQPHGPWHDRVDNGNKISGAWSAMRRFSAGQVGRARRGRVDQRDVTSAGEPSSMFSSFPGGVGRRPLTNNLGHGSGERPRARRRLAGRSRFVSGQQVPVGAGSRAL